MSTTLQSTDSIFATIIRGILDTEALPELREEDLLPEFWD